MMDIVELSLKMEANLLASYSSESGSESAFKHSCESSSQRLTRSQTNKGQKHLMEENEVIGPLKRSERKVEVEKIYLNKKPKVVHKNLETIYEDPIWKKGNTMLLGTSKIKRSIYLDREFRITSKQKSKLRKMKIRRLGKRTKPFKISDEEFNRKMLKIENFLNNSDQEVRCKNEDLDVEFNNCETVGDCNGLGSGSGQRNGDDDGSSSENKDFELEMNS